MNQTWSGAIIALALLLSSSVTAFGQRSIPDLTVSNSRVYHVTITTELVVPKDGTKATVLRVWHALPTPRPWDGMNRTLGASAITCTP